MMRLGIILFALSAAQLFAGYTMIRVEGPPPNAHPAISPVGIALNNNGVALVQGTFLNPGVGAWDQAYLATAIDAPGAFATVLPLNSQLPAPYCCLNGMALNDAGQATGWAFGNGNLVQAFRSTTSATTALPLPGPSIVGRAINSAGLIAGNGYNALGTFVGDPNGITYLPNDITWSGAEAFALAENGTFFGAAYTLTGLREIFTASASGYSQRTLLDPALLGYSSINPQVANKSGTFAGVASNSANQVVAWVLSAGGSVTPLPLPGTWSYLSVKDINENGAVTGEGYRNGVYVPWAYSAAAGFVELTGFPYSLTNVYAMNDRGDILGKAAGSIMLLRSDASPSSSAVPEPSSLALATAGLLWAGARLRRRP